MFGGSEIPIHNLRAVCACALLEIDCGGIAGGYCGGSFWLLR